MPAVYRILIILLSIIVGLQTSVGLPQKATEKPQLSVQLAPTKKAYGTGEPILIRIVIVNRSPRTFYVGREFSHFTWMYGLDFFLADEQGNPLPREGYASDPPASPPDLYDTVLRGWVALGPGYSYGADVRLADLAPGFVSRPGRYRIWATYKSLGLEGLLYFHRSKDLEEQIRKLPFPSWKGEVKTNSVWVEIIPNSTR